MRSGLLGAMATPMRPVGPSGRPCPVSFVQVSPLSADLYNPSSGPPLSKSHAAREYSQMPAYKVFGFFGSIARSDAPLRSPTKSVLVHVLPPSAVRNTPRSEL